MGQGSGSKKKRQAKTSLRSETSVSLGGGTGVGGAGNGIEVQPLTFQLVKVNPGVLARTSPGDGVGLQQAGLGWEVLTHNGRLGDVPARFRDRVLISGFRKGAVVAMQQGRVTVTIG